MDMTPRLGLPLLSAGQMQKEEWHNEALLLLDSLTGGQIEGAQSSAPPANPEAGLVYRVGASPSGAWAGQAGKLAVQSAAGWRFFDPCEGLRLTERSSGFEWLFAGGGWLSGRLAGSRVEIDGIKVIGPRASAIATPTGGASVDTEARAAIADILGALRQHGLIGT